MQDINGLIKECDNDNLLLDTLKHFINDLNKIMGAGEIPEDVLDEFVTNNTEGFVKAFELLKYALGMIVQGGGSGGSGGSTLKREQLLVRDIIGEATEYIKVIIEDNVKQGSRKRVTFDTGSGIAISGSIDTTLTRGKLKIGNFDDTNIGMYGIAPCKYEVDEYESGYIPGVVEFDDNDIYLIPSKNFTNSTTNWLSVDFVGSTAWYYKRT